MTRRYVIPEQVKFTAKQFKEYTGRSPIEDDLERVNCPHMGEISHAFCGWNPCKNVPIFESCEHRDGCDCPPEKVSSEPHWRK